MFFLPLELGFWWVEELTTGKKYDSIYNVPGNKIQRNIYEAVEQNKVGPYTRTTKNGEIIAAGNLPEPTNPKTGANTYDITKQLGANYVGKDYTLIVKLNGKIQTQNKGPVSLNTVTKEPDPPVGTYYLHSLRYSDPVFEQGNCEGVGITPDGRCKSQATEEECTGTQQPYEFKCKWNKPTKRKGVVSKGNNTFITLNAGTKIKTLKIDQVRDDGSTKGGWQPVFFKNKGGFREHNIVFTFVMLVVAAVIWGGYTGSMLFRRQIKVDGHKGVPIPTIPQNPTAVQMQSNPTYTSLSSMAPDMTHSDKVVLSKELQDFQANVKLGYPEIPQITTKAA